MTWNTCSVGKTIDVGADGWYEDGKLAYEVVTLHEVLDEAGAIIGYGTTKSYAGMLAKGLNDSLAVDNIDPIV